MSQSTLEQAFRYSHIGLTMTIIGGIFFYGGLKLDQYFQISPWGMLGGLFVGLLAGFFYFFVEISRMSDDLDSPGDPESS